jgi:hypothetical protein
MSIGIETWLNLTERFQPDIVIGIETRLNLTERFQLDIVIGKFSQVSIPITISS